MFDSVRDFIQFFDNRKSMEHDSYDRSRTVEMAYDRWVRGGNEKFYLTEVQKRGRFDIFERFRLLFKNDVMDKYDFDKVAMRTVEGIC
jgi:hypothetical protein